jgi:anti-sigma factor RsiW
MKSACEKWKDSLLEAALTGAATKELEEHLQSCASCSAELDEVRARKARLDTLLPLVAREAEPAADFRARVLAAAESASEGKRGRPWRVWTLAGATAVVVVALTVGMPLLRRNGPAVTGDELAAAQKLAEWRAPSDGLLKTPGQEILMTTPKLGNSYLNVPVKTDEEE